MTERESFKFGFLARCLEERLDAAQVDARVAAALEKQAADWKDILLSALGKLTTGVGRGARFGAMAYPLAMAGGGLAGLVAGHAAGSLLDPGYDPDDIKRRELLSAYETAGDDVEDAIKTREELAR